MISSKINQTSVSYGLTVLLGGARSGKSSLAVDLASTLNLEVCFIATAEAQDDEMKQRIESHKSQRPNWKTIEEPIDLRKAINECPKNSAIIIVCLTLWISNLVMAGYTDTAIRQASALAISLIGQRISSTIVVTNEVGLGIVPSTEIGRRYRDSLGIVNQQWVRASKRSLFLVAGKALKLSEPREFLS